MEFPVFLEYPYGVTSHSQFLLAWRVLGVAVADNEMHHGSDSCGLWVAKDEASLTAFLRDEYVDDWEQLDEVLANNPHIIRFSMDWKESLLSYHDEEIAQLREWGIDIIKPHKNSEAYIVSRKDCGNVSFPKLDKETLLAALLAEDDITYWRAVTVLRNTSTPTEVVQELLTGVYNEHGKPFWTEQSPLFSMPLPKRNSTLLILLGQLACEQQRLAFPVKPKATKPQDDEPSKLKNALNDLLASLETSSQSGNPSNVINHLKLEQIDFIPVEIGKLQDLQSLHINNQELTGLVKKINRQLNRWNAPRITKLRLPPQIGDLQKLQELNLCHNEMDAIPQNLARLPNLKKLDIRGTSMRYPHHVVKRLGSLKELYLSPRFPDYMQEHVLSNLEILNCSDIRLQALPEWIRSLPNLWALDLSGCGLKELPEWIGELDLWYLKLGGNPLTSLPRSLCNMPNLKCLDLTDSKWFVEEAAFDTDMGCPVRELPAGLFEKLSHLIVYTEQRAQLFGNRQDDRIVTQGDGLLIHQLDEQYHAIIRAIESKKLGPKGGMEIFPQYEQQFNTMYLQIHHSEKVLQWLRTERSMIQQGCNAQQIQEAREQHNELHNLQTQMHVALNLAGLLSALGEDNE